MKTVADCNNYSLLLISVVNKFRVLNFHGQGRLRKYFNNKNVPIYDSWNAAIGEQLPCKSVKTLKL